VWDVLALVAPSPPDADRPSAVERHLDKGDVAEEIAKLKQQPGKNIETYGSAVLMQTLMEHNLIDEYRIRVHPFVIGGGKRLFTEGGQSSKLHLGGTKTLSSGVVILTYTPATAPPSRRRCTWRGAAARCASVLSAPRNLWDGCEPGRRRRCTAADRVARPSSACRRACDRRGTAGVDRRLPVMRAIEVAVRPVGCLVPERDALSRAHRSARSGAHAASRIHPSTRCSSAARWHRSPQPGEVSGSNRR
jgi:RibD C-terminal domain